MHEALEQQACGDQQDHGQRDLGSEQRLAQRSSRQSSTNGARRFLQRRQKVLSGRGNRRNKPRHQGREKHDDGGENQNGGIHLNGLGPRQVLPVSSEPSGGEKRQQY